MFPGKINGFGGLKKTSNVQLPALRWAGKLHTSSKRNVFDMTFRFRKTNCAFFQLQNHCNLFGGSCGRFEGTTPLFQTRKCMAPTPAMVLFGGFTSLAACRTWWALGKGDWYIVLSSTFWW
jgi:hypothetical protein